MYQRRTLLLMIWYDLWMRKWMRESFLHRKRLVTQCQILCVFSAYSRRLYHQGQSQRKCFPLVCVEKVPSLEDLVVLLPIGIFFQFHQQEDIFPLVPQWLSLPQQGLILLQWTYAKCITLSLEEKHVLGKQRASKTHSACGNCFYRQSRTSSCVFFDYSFSSSTTSASTTSSFFPSAAPSCEGCASL